MLHMIYCTRFIAVDYITSTTKTSIRWLTLLLFTGLNCTRERAFNKWCDDHVRSISFENGYLQLIISQADTLNRSWCFASRQCIDHGSQQGVGPHVEGINHGVDFCASDRISYSVAYCIAYCVAYCVNRSVFEIDVYDVHWCCKRPAINSLIMFERFVAIPHSKL